MGNSVAGAALETVFIAQKWYYGVIAVSLLLFFWYRHIFLASLCFVLRRPKAYPKEAIRTFMRFVREGPIVHRGGTPENTLTAIRSAKQDGAVAVEVDVRMTSDGQCVLLHDETVDRSSDGSGRVDDLTLEELRKLDFGCKFGSQYAGERITTLEDAVALSEELDLLLFLDVKPFTTEEDAKKLLTIFTEKPERYSRICIISYNTLFLYRLRCTDPNVVCGLCTYCSSLLHNMDVMGISLRNSLLVHLISVIYDYLFFWSLDALLLEFVGIEMVLFCKDDLFTKRVKWTSKSRNLIVWTVNKELEKKWFSEKKIPYFTDSVLDELPEAWIPPERKLLISYSFL